MMRIYRQSSFLNYSKTHASEFSSARNRQLAPFWWYKAPKRITKNCRSVQAVTDIFLTKLALTTMLGYWIQVLNCTQTASTIATSLMSRPSNSPYRWLARSISISKSSWCFRIENLVSQLQAWFTPTSPMLIRPRIWLCWPGRHTIQQQEQSLTIVTQEQEY